MRQSWIREYHPLSDEIVRGLERGSVPALSKVLGRCAVLRERGLVVLEADCVVAAAR